MRIWAKNNSTFFVEIASGASFSDKFTNSAPPDETGDYVYRDQSWVAKNAVSTSKAYSKLKLIRALKTAGMWDGIKAAITTAGAEDEWNAAAWLASDDPLFLSLSESLLQAYPDVDLNSILTNCLY